MYIKFNQKPPNWKMFILFSIVYLNHQLNYKIDLKE